MESFYQKDGVVETSVDLSNQSMTVKWSSLSDDVAIKECCEAQLEQVKGGINKLFLDVSEAQGVPTQERQDWFAQTLFPSFADNGMKAIFTILPKSAITKLASKKWTKTGAPFNFDMFDVASLSDAQELAKEF
ncbi:hypothetical protein [Reichenbachiella versicolor]|uniref:hypothetical protein n=1 Tax=Reichenbachiella versicolor TaxID=1821036 RepID=UPI000D6DFBEA|nr:hypothetical protein [Reichenbachiella versicolor]